MKFAKIIHLYKYYSFNEHSISVLSDRMIWVSKPEKLNDPFDIAIDINPITSHKFSKFINLLRKMNNLPLETRESLNNINPNSPNRDALACMNQVMCNKLRNDRANWGVFCMSKDPENIVMWSHYADHHKGFCIQFTRNSENTLGNIEKTRPVKYRKKYPSPSLTLEGIKSLFDDLFFTKAVDWKYEKEWRILYDQGDKKEPLPGDISAIIFGLRMPKDQREDIKNILSDSHGINFIQTQKVDNKFKLKII